MVINCVVVTYNRLALLKECLAALKNQTYSLNKVIVVDNCSTDGTPEFLQELKHDPLYFVIRTNENVGGAGGFALGMKAAVKEGCDYVWLMDDDTIPASDALEALVQTLQVDENVGFVCSRVNWTDGTPHVMNKAGLLYDNHEPIKVEVGGQTALRCDLCSFVSVLVSTAAIRKLGLPIKEFFIWCDDIEYTLRISKAGYSCFYVEKSIVCHKTASNYSPSIDKAPVSMAWRFYYQARNRCYMKHREMKCKLFFYISVGNMYRIYKHRIGKRNDGHKDEFVKAVKKGCKDGLTFFPEIEFVE